MRVLPGCLKGVLQAERCCPSSRGWEGLTGAHAVGQVAKQQQMKENARLRATLEEWSHRNLKCAEPLPALCHAATLTNESACQAGFCCRRCLLARAC